MAPGTLGYGSAPVSLASTLSGPDGNFSFNNVPYTCPSGNVLVYMTATGGDSGSGTNTAFAAATLVGPCSSLTAQTFVEINEVTTVAAAYALAPFAAVTPLGTGIGTSSRNLTGLANANGPAGNLVDIGTGIANAPAAISGMVVPQATVNTLADIIAACVNTSGALTPSTTACARLFAAATPAGGAAPVDTFQAALNIALNPAQNAAALFALSSAEGPFQPTLSAAPAEWTLGIGFTGAPIDPQLKSTSVAIDAGGNAWIAWGGYYTGIHSLIEISPAGVFLSPAAGFGYSNLAGTTQVAIDAQSNVFVGATNFHAVVKFDSSGKYVSSTTGPGLTSVTNLAFSPDGLLWVTGDESVLDYIDTSVPTVSFVGNTAPTGTGIATSATAIYAGCLCDSFTKVDEVTKAVTLYSPDSGAYYYDLQLDAGGNLWATRDHGLSKFTAAGVAISPAGGYTLPQLPMTDLPYVRGLAIDGLNRSWISYYAGQQEYSGALGEYANDGTLITPAEGLRGAGVVATYPAASAIDSSGNIWVVGASNAFVADSGSPPNVVTSYTVSEVIGVAAPVTTPLSVATQKGLLGQRP